MTSFPPADLLMVLHFLWVAFMVLGLPLGILLKSPALRWVHLGGMLLTALLAVAGWYCPLTVWEDDLRRTAGESLTSPGSFLGRHIAPLLYPAVDETVLRTGSALWGAATAASFLVFRIRRP